MDKDSFWFYNAVIRSVAKQANIPIAEAAQMVKRSFLKRMIFKVDVFFQLFESVIPDSCDDLF